jgi:hypothetical protein
MRSYLNRILSPVAAGIVCIFFASCAVSTNVKRVAVYKNQAVFTVPDDILPEDEDILKVTGRAGSFPQLSEASITAMLGNLKYKREGLIGKSIRPVFYEEELKELVPIFMQAMLHSPPGQRLIVFSRYDHDRSVLSRAEKVSFLCFAGDDGINILFGDIREPIPIDDPLAEDRWLFLPVFRFLSSQKDVRIESDTFFKFKKVNNMDHRGWVVFDPAVIANLKYAPPVSKSDKPETAKDSEEANLEKLRQLKKAKDEGLITEEEYQAKKKEILKDF